MFSFVIATKNSKNSLIDCLNSIFSQTLDDDEVIVVDDNSTDNTAEEIQSKFGERKNFICLQNPSSGISSARNFGNARATKEYVFVMDADDQLSTGALEQVRTCASKGSADVFYGDIDVVFKGRTIDYSPYPEIKSLQCAKRSVILRPILPFKHSALIYKTEAWRKIGGYDESLMSKVDIDLVLAFIRQKCRIQKINHKLAIHFKHENQVSHKRLKGLKNWKKVIWKHESNWILRPLYFTIRCSTEVLKSLIGG